VDAQARESARDWLLTYNRGDVEATLAIRDWLEREAPMIPRVDSLDAAFAHDGGCSVPGVAGQ
jgi:hypothetical protein